MEDLFEIITIWGLLIFNVIVFGILEFYLAGRKNKWIGLLIPVLSLVLLVPLSIDFIDEFSEIPVWENSYGDETLDDVKIYFGVINDKSGSPVAFSDLQVKDRSSGEKKWYPMEFDQQGNLIGGKEALKYKSSIEDLSQTDGFFTGKSCSPKAMKWEYVKGREGGRYRSQLILAALYIVVIAFYFFIYWIMRKRLCRREAAVAEEKRQMLKSL
ncbi:Uncharacterised protein [uncultured Eubacterium sp.]|nr:Uncharacterised protein [uncultured Eubacterium sp.]